MNFGFWANNQKTNTRNTFWFFAKNQKPKLDFHFCFLAKNQKPQKPKNQKIKNYAKNQKPKMNHATARLPKEKPDRLKEQWLSIIGFLVFGFFGFLVFGLVRI